MSNNRSKAAQDKAQEAQKAQAVAAMTATRQAEAAPLPGEKEAPAQADAERMAELEKQLAEVKAAHEAALKELAEAKKAGAADRSEGASPATGQGEYVYVYANLPSGQVFTLPDGGRVEIKGVPASLLRGPDGQRLKGGKYGVTRVRRAEWEAVLRLYGGMSLFRDGLVFAVNSEHDGGQEAHGRRDMRHGFEPLDPAGKKVKPTPADRDDADV